jgi:DnaJ-domain-containing protein 1
MPPADDTRYGDTAPPTLEQLRAMLESIAEAKALRNKSGNRTRLIFDIDAARVHAKGGSCYCTGPQIAQVLLDAIGRLLYFDQVTADYSSPDRKGTTPADIIAFINNELKHVHSGFDMESNMRRRMFNETLQKLTELGVWRAAVDAERFRKAQEAERKRQEDLAERTRRAHEENAEHMRRQQEFERRQREKAEKERRESRAGADRPAGGKAGPNPFEGMFDEDFTNAFYEGMSKGDRHRQYYGFGSAFGGADFAGNSNDRKRQERQNGPKARHKEREPWHVVLGVPPGSDKATIKSAWRKLCSKWQPRTNAEALEVERTEMMKKINTAKDEGLKGL